jgi:uncharacterized protein YcbK (DUF882 family)
MYLIRIGEVMETEHFKEHELVCHCGCGKSDMDVDFMERLEDLRVWYGKPIILSSAFRCPSYNDKISTTGLNGPHTTGQAVDILVHGMDGYNIFRACFVFGFTGVGVNQKGSLGGRFIHLDNLTEPDHPRPRVWSY